MTPEELDGLRKDLLAVVYQQAATQLLIFKQGQRLQPSVPPPPSNSRRSSSIVRPKGTSRRSSSWSTSSSTRRGGGARPKIVGDDSEKLPSEKVLNEIKLDRELKGLIDIYTVAYRELSSGESRGQELRQAVELRREDDDAEERQRQELAQHRSELRALNDEIETGQREAAERMAAADDRIATLRHNLRNVRRVNDLELDLVTRWEETRYTQATIVGEKDEATLEQEIAALRRKVEGEQRIGCELESFRAKQFAEYRRQIDEWQRKYAREAMRYEGLLQAKRHRIRDLGKQDERHRQTYEQRVAFVADYLLQRAEEERLHQQQVHRIECAVQIQAWWRGVMVRRGLGPYKKKSKKGKKAKQAKAK